MTKFSTTIVLSALYACGGSQLAAESESETQAPTTRAPQAEAFQDSTQITEQRVFLADEIQYTPCPPSLPEGCMMAVLDGNPKEPGLFTMRVRSAGAFTVAPHGHSGMERVTVLEGSVHVGFGDVVDKTQGRAFSAGDFYVNPPDAAHYVWSDGPVTLQISGYGPRGTHSVSAQVDNEANH